MCSGRDLVQADRSLSRVDRQAEAVQKVGPTQEKESLGSVEKETADGELDVPDPKRELAHSGARAAPLDAQETGLRQRVPVEADLLRQTAGRHGKVGAGVDQEHEAARAVGRLDVDGDLGVADRPEGGPLSAEGELNRH